jgi:hypothetical protein
VALSRFRPVPDTSLLFDSIHMRMNGPVAQAFATYRDERAQLLHKLLTYEIQLVACLSPAGYSTVFQD